MRHKRMSLFSFKVTRKSVFLNQVRESQSRMKTWLFKEIHMKVLTRSNVKCSSDRIQIRCHSLPLNRHQHLSTKLFLFFLSSQFVNVSLRSLIPPALTGTKGFICSVWLSVYLQRTALPPHPREIHSFYGSLIPFNGK